ncbi:sensor histidine kinase [Cypionkella aquatica]|uniref:histidine kinase n=1 Tax=Cypionkella aquatica TaxID=1756042 RepID=A0AA37TWL8_9RHOB|nr:GAF domain-containing sensor histidine kinase [Cypionkella aquatica]GLS86097.1 sensor histidine kinase [Cypionkella aquatica]
MTDDLGLPSQNSLEVDRIQRIDQASVILDACCRLTGMGFCAIARVTDTKWLTCAALDHVQFGLKPGDELPLHTTICDEIREHRQVVVIDDVCLDPHYRDHHTPKTYGLGSYISVPIILQDGSFFGTLCAIDTQPHKINTPEIIGIFKMFADLIAAQLNAQDTVEKTTRALEAERENARVREEFIAVVGHDLRNPVTALAAGLRLLERNVSQPELVTREMKKSISRINSIISNLMDLARGRLGGGIPASKEHAVPLNDIINDVVNEIRAFSDQEIIVNSTIVDPIACDAQRIAQLLSNLVGNAVAHGSDDAPVVVAADTRDDMLTITVSNKGSTIPPEVLEGLFQPFKRGATSGGNGLGLGLYISAEIARGHGGALIARSDGEDISFAFSMPLGA